MKKLFAMLLTAASLIAHSTDPKTAYDLALEGKAVIVDVREKDEIELGMVEHAKWFPLSRMKNDQAWQEDFKKITEGKTIFLHCRSGARSEKAKNLLKDQGIRSENLGGYETLKHVLPTRGAK